MAAYRFINQTTAVKVLRFFDEDGELLPTPYEAAAQRAEAEAAARRAAEAKIARLQALLAQQGRE